MASTKCERWFVSGSEAVRSFADWGYVVHSSRNRISLTLVAFCGLVPASAIAALDFVTQWGAHGNGPGQFSYPTGVAIAPDGDVFVSDGGNSRLCRFTPDGQFVATIGGGGSGPGRFQGPDNLQFSPTNGDLYVTDKNNHRIQRLTEAGAFVLEWGSFGTGPGQFDAPWGIHVDASGNVWVTSREQMRVQKFTENGQFLAEWGVQGTGPGQFLNPHGIATDEAGNVYIDDVYRCDIQKFDSALGYLMKWGSEGSGPGQFLHPEHICYAHGLIVVVDFFTHPHAGRLSSWSTSGAFQEVMVAGPAGICDMCFDNAYDAAQDAQGYWYVVEWANHRIKKLREETVGVESLAGTSASVLGQPSPNPSSGAVRVPLEFPATSVGPYELAIFDVRGQRVFARRLPLSRELLWDGMDRSGRAVGAGVYFIDLRGEGVHETRKMVRVH